MIRKKPKPQTTSYDISEEPIVLSKHTIDLLLKSKNPSNCIALYTFLYYTAKWQKTNQPKATISYIGKALKWGERKVRETKSYLINVGLIENIREYSEKSKKTIGWYIKVNFIWSKNSTLPKSAGVVSVSTQNSTLAVCHSVDSNSTNALISSNQNALSSNNTPIPPIKEISSIKIFKKYLPKVFLKNKTLLPNIKEFIAHRKDIKKPLSDRAIKIICNRCKDYNTKEVQTAFETACINGNIGVFPNKEYKNNYPKKDQHAPNAVKAEDKTYGKAFYRMIDGVEVPNEAMKERLKKEKINN